MKPDILQRSVTVGAPDAGNVYAVDATSTVLKLRVPDQLRGSFVRFLAKGSDVQLVISWANEPPDLEFGAMSIFDGDELIVNPLRGSTLQDGVPEQFVIPDAPRKKTSNTKLWMSIVAKTTATVEFYSTEGWNQL